MDSKTNVISFQGWAGANSDMACRTLYPGYQTHACPTFEETIGAVEEGRADLAMIPIDNSVAGRVADIHHLLPHSSLHIVREHFQRVRHNLLARPGTGLAEIREVHSHVHAIGQCKEFLRAHGLTPVVHADTAGAARMISESAEPGRAAIASTLAAEIYGLEVLASDIEDAEHNTTRFVVMASEPKWPEAGTAGLLTSFVFEVRSVPAALYKALGGFATNGINMTKLESYMVEGRFSQAQFYADVEGHPQDPPMRRAFEELDFFTKSVRIMGVYPAHSFRSDPSQTTDAAD
ncbi:prephenate dehydratase [Fodinicurvata sp. EGI_FJ10296]|uniref:prephenate dehydratase n=1 Tax=Fodinicurvata sp. EGI_FJ10296 TaxID=3231908 RepID=UPI0034563DD6